MMAPADWQPTARLEVLKLRSEMLRRTRQFFYDRDFIEVETPTLSADIVVDRHLDPISVILPDDPRFPEVGRKLWLQTSPEFGMKRLLAAGASAIFQITRAYRAGEQGPLHNPEFTMLEWYRTGDEMAAGMKLLSDVAEVLVGRGAAEVVTYADAFRQGVGVDPHTASAAELRESAERLGVIAPASFAGDRDDWLDLLLTDRVQPHLGRSRPTVLCDYPATQAALARVRAAEPPIAERFELYVNGVELANGYHELLDPAVLSDRARHANLQRAEDGKVTLPEDSRLLAAMASGLPACCGTALGFDRAVMVAVGAKSLPEVMAFPIERA
jgi:elongation factor P--(R)-beta-lysine ligase